MLKYDTSSHPFREDLIGDAISTVNGKVPVPQVPGIGVEVDRGVLERYGNRVRLAAGAGRGCGWVEAGADAALPRVV